MKTKLCSWLLLCCLGVLFLSGCTGLVSHTVREDPVTARTRSPSPTGQYIVVFQDRAIPAGARAAIAAAGGEVCREFPQIGVLVAKSTDPDFPNRAAAIPGVLDVGSDPWVRLPDEDEDDWVVLDPPVDPIPLSPSAELAPFSLPIDRNDLYVRFQWDIRRVGGVLETWLIQQGEGVTVAVLDTGVYSNYPGATVHPVHVIHPDIQLNLAYGKSFVDPTAPLPPGWVALDDLTPQDYYGHGTHVAGAIAATMLDGRIIGVAPRARIANYKVLMTVRTADGYITGIGLSSWIIAGLMEAADDGVHVANLSLGGAGLLTDPEDLAAYLAYCRATQYAWERGVLVVAAAGNDALDWSRGPWRRWPAMAPATLAITATGPDDRLAVYSDYGAFNADFTAPGGSIPEVTYPFWWWDWLCLSAWSPVSRIPGFFGARWVFTAGTSMAAPKVSGVAALVIAANRGITPTGGVRILERTAEDLGAPGFDFRFGWGLAHAYRALTQ